MSSDDMNLVVWLVGIAGLFAFMLALVFLGREDDKPEQDEVDRAWSDLLAAGLREHTEPQFRAGDRVIVDLGFGLSRPGVVTRAGLDTTVARIVNPATGSDTGANHYMVRLDGRRRAEPFHASQLRPDNLERTPTLADIDQIVKGDQP